MRLVSAYYEEYYPFDQLPCVDSGVCVTDPRELQKNDILVVWGGADISPSLYNKPVAQRCHAEVQPSRRDIVEWMLMKQAHNMGVPIIGVCRGAQMLCALAGGFLLQHVNNHGGHHVVSTPDGYEFSTNSIHHQMMYPWDVKHEMLASIKPARSDKHYDVDNLVEIKEEPEFVYFPTVKGFAVQWHPEAMAAQSEATRFIFKQIEERVGVSHS